MEEILRDYFFGNGGNLIPALEHLPHKQMNALLAAIAGCQGRVFFLGNGGSFDNARQIAQWFRRCGIESKVPGNPEDYFLTAEQLVSDGKLGYASIFEQGLAYDQINPADIAVGISGSGNSESILCALEAAQCAGAKIFCLGGRDGGRMKKICGEAHSLIAATDCMEAIEDIHLFMMLAIVRALREEQTTEQVENFADDMREIFFPETLDVLSTIGKMIMQRAEVGGRCFVLGTDIGSNHIRADLSRGATNTIPNFRILLPEVFTMNSAQATANDDGLDFILAHGLQSFRPDSNDFALLVEGPQKDAKFAHCREILDAAKTIYCSTSVLMGCAPSDLYEILISMFGHAWGYSIRQCLMARYSVRLLDIPVKFPAGQKKLGLAATRKLEANLRKAGTLASEEVLTFCYGAAYAAKTK